MATNNFKPFATAANANVTAQADWESLPALLSGFTAGKASSAQVNKAIRQATTIAALVGQFIANSGADALDNADVNGLVTKFTNALTTNLGLGGAAKRDVGTSANQIPDMSGFTRNLVNNGWQKFPGGLVIQWGIGGMPAGVLTGDLTFPIAFPSTVFAILATDTGGASVPYGTTNRSKTGFTLTRTSNNGSGSVTGFYLAIGA